MKTASSQSRSIIILIALIAVISSCRQMDGDGHAKVATKNKLKSLDFLFRDLEAHSYKDDLTQHHDSVMLVKDVISDVDIDKNLFIDGWKNEFKCMLSGDYFFIWSSGKNQIDDKMQADDIFLKLEISEITSIRTKQ
jgi:hypothetical protein